MEHCIIYDKFEDKELTRISFPEAGGAARQEENLAEGQGIIIVPLEAISTIPANRDVIRTAYQNRVDIEAELTRAQFIPCGSGQVLSYINKRAEAVAFTADPSAPTPILSLEAETLGITVAELVVDVLAAAARSDTIEGMIEGVRRSTKQSIANAVTLEEIKTGSVADWSALYALV